MSPYEIYRGAFRSYYQISAYRGKDIHPAAELMRFNCPIFTHRFLRDICAPWGFWQHLLSPGELNWCVANSRNENGFCYSMLECISQQLIRKRLWIFEFPDLLMKSATNHKGEAFRFVKGPVPYPVDDLKPLPLHDDSQVDALLDSLANIGAGQWHDILNERGLSSDKINPRRTSLDEYHKIIRKFVLAGDLLVYQTRIASAPPKRAEELLPPDARDQLHASIEEPRYYTEFEFLHPDLSCVADSIPYVVRFADGSQKAGALDNSGYVHINHIPPGSVEVEFGDPQAKAQLDSAKKELKSYLNGIVSEVQARGKRLDAELDKLNVLTQGAVLTGAFLVGLYNDALDVADAAKMIAETGIDVITDIEKTKQKALSIIVKGDIKAAKQELEMLAAYGEETLSTLQDTYNTLQLLYTDDEIKTLLMEFPGKYR